MKEWYECFFCGLRWAFALHCTHCGRTTDRVQGVDSRGGLWFLFNRPRRDSEVDCIEN